EEPALPVSLTEPLVANPARTVEADAVLRETPPARRPTAQASFLSGINWADPELLSVIATFVFMMLGRFGHHLGLPAELAPWLYLAAYLTGGWHGTIHGIRSVLKGAV